MASTPHGEYRVEVRCNNILSNEGLAFSGLGANSEEDEMRDVSRSEGPVCYYCGKDVGFYAEVREYRETKTERLLGWYIRCDRCAANNYISIEDANRHRKSLGDAGACDSQ